MEFDLILALENGGYKRIQPDPCVYNIKGNQIE